jgi:hypothetical protein
MVQATDFANRDDPAEFWRLNCPAVGRILVEREVSTRPVVVREVGGQQAAQVPFAEDEYVIQTLAPDGADEPLREGILPRTAGGGEHFTDPHAFHSLLEEVTVDRLAIAEEIGRRGIVREGVNELLGGLGGGGVLGLVEVEDAQTSDRNGEEVDRDDPPDSGWAGPAVKSIGSLSSTPRNHRLTAVAGGAILARGGAGATGWRPRKGF